MRPTARTIFQLAVSIALTLVASNGCVQTTTGPQRSHDVFQKGDLPQSTGTSNGQPVSPEELTAKDRCPARLHEIAGALLEYDVDHRELPPTLAELHAYAPNLQLVCPDSMLPYVYVPAGLRKPGGTKRIIVHDAVRNADGTRWCIMVADSKPGKPQEAEVVQLPEPLFLAYQ